MMCGGIVTDATTKPALGVANVWSLSCLPHDRRPATFWQQADSLFSIHPGVLLFHWLFFYQQTRTGKWEAGVSNNPVLCCALLIIVPSARTTAGDDGRCCFS
jgi:hypothetical protein